jgi:BirA family biotin operon repressor/biotin-[acetyl-CoA-carboxylase] ligase
VWKAVQALKRNGFPLEAGAQGYRLEADAPIRIAELEYRGSVGSTMDEARGLARAGAAEFGGVLAERQTSGRGRRGRAWQSPAGSGLYLSLVLRPNLPLSSLGLLPLLAGACLHRAIQTQTGLEAVLKWSNDLLVPDGRKLAGVLLESEVEDGAARFVVLGMGVNVRLQDFPAELNAAALEEFVPSVDRKALLEALLGELKTQYTRFLEQPASALSLWRAVNGTLGRTVRVLEPSGNSWTGTALEVTSDGGLQVQTTDGLKTVFAGDVSLRHA